MRVQLLRFFSFGAARPALRPLLVAAILAAVCSATPAFARPPIPPLEVQLTPLDPLLPGHVARFRITAVPRFPADEITIEVVPGPGVTWVAGARRLRTTARRDVALERVFSVRVPDHGRRPLYVRFEATGPNGARWRRGAGIGLGPQAQGRAVQDGRGGEAIEYDAAKADAR